MSAESSVPLESSVRLSLPAVPAVCVTPRHVYILDTDGEIKTLPPEQARMALHKGQALVCHGPYVRGRLGLERLDAFDVLELFAFVHPGRFAVPTPAGLCKALSLAPPDTPEDAPLSLLDIAQTLLGALREDPFKAKADPLSIAGFMGLNGQGWAWTPFVFSALGQVYDPDLPIEGKKALAVWKNLPEWTEDAPEPAPSHHGVTVEETQERLTRLLGPEAETRDAQRDYALHIANAFDPVEDAQDPHIVLAEAGTGIGKTLGYLAPASVWAEKNKGSVWVSTYTKNLQRQIDAELSRLYPNPAMKAAHVATRKGRENYLCLLNLEESAAGAALAKHAGAALGAGIMARWSAASIDGDLTGAQFPGWLSGLLGYAHTTGLSDRRGECLFSACDHYKKCFVEHSARRAQHARIVVANHALVMANAALSSPVDALPARYVFDEGHHLFDAADSAFCVHLSARETRDFRRWVLGIEGGRRQGRARGLKRRIEDLTEGMPDAQDLLRKIVSRAEALPMEGWSRRLKDDMPQGPCEQFLHAVMRQVYARAQGREGPYSLETETYPLNPDIAERARTLGAALIALQQPMRALGRVFRKKLKEDDGKMAGDTRSRLDSISLSLERRADFMLQGWIDMLRDLETGETPGAFVDWMEIERIDGHAVDVGLCRHAVDPMKPFAASLRPHLHGMAVTSATLGEDRYGAGYLAQKTVNVSYRSPFDYENRTKIFILNDVRKDDTQQVAGAVRALFRASGGGALGLFTAISRLRGVYEAIAPALEEDGLPLYAQHVDAIDTGTLIDMFRDDPRACLLGTDAIRDGVDVPGESLRLIAFDRTPWPRPTILHKARRDAFGGRAYDEMLTRLKLKQAFGRLIRRASDKGVFVMLDSALPSRLHDAFPEDAEVVKASLREAVEEISGFLGA